MNDERLDGLRLRGVPMCRTLMCGSKSFCRGCFSNLRRLAGKTILIHELCFLAALRPVLFASIAVFSSERFRTAPLRASSPKGLFVAVSVSP